MKLRCFHCHKICKSVTFRAEGDKKCYCSFRCLSEYEKKHAFPQRFERMRKENEHVSNSTM
jgi:hypothetical protein